MKIILMRHGDAGAYTTPDRERPLSPLGKQQATATATQLNTQQNRPDFFITSPYKRAQQTLLQVQNTLQIPQKTPENTPIKQINTLTNRDIIPDHDPKLALISLTYDIDRLLTIHPHQNPDQTCILIVCHMPIIAHLAALISDTPLTAFELAECRIFEIDDINLTHMGLAKPITQILP